MKNKIFDTVIKNFMDSMNAIFVQKRDGSKEEVSFDKVLQGMKSLSSNLDVNAPLLPRKFVIKFMMVLDTTELDILGVKYVWYDYYTSRLPNSRGKNYHV